MSAKFDKETCNGVVSIVFTRSMHRRTDTRTHGTTAALLYPHRNALRGDNNTSSQMFRSLLCIRFVAVAFRSEEEVLWRRGPPWPILAPPWIRPWADLAVNNTCKGPWVLHQNLSSGSGEEVENVNCLTDDGRTDGRTDRRTTDDRRRTTRDHNRSLEPSAPVP